MAEKQFRLRVGFSCHVKGDDPADALALCAIALRHIGSIQDVRKLEIHENGEFFAKTPDVPIDAQAADKAEAQPETEQIL